MIQRTAAAVLAFPILNNRDAFAQGVTKALDEKSPQAQALGYYHDASKVDVTKWTRKAGPDGATMNCANCQLVLARGKKADGMDGEWAQCALFQDGLVNIQGWCNSWVQKQGV
jgi:hypothetical protein